ncbi:MAG TPA: 4Fe-4S binding protein [Melioribacteraceae bacterium]|nr:4Fe-4S binding protein [Melioribacteraceae bacterium]
MNKLKVFRVSISVIVFVLTLSLFFEITRTILQYIAHPILFLQFIPSLFKFFTGLSFVSIGFLLILLLTSIVGRVYCSTICPFGILQDIVSFVSKKINYKHKYRFRIENKWLRYGMLLLTIATPFFVTMALVNLLDPYSNFGRIASQLFSPIYIFFNNLVSSVFEIFGSYAVKPIGYKSIRFELLVFPLVMLLTVGYLAFRFGRLYCNTICPVGTLLGLVSKYSLFKIKLDDDKCKSCGKCEFVCKSECIDSKKKSVDFDRCVGCFNCLSVCPSKGITLKYDHKKTITSKDESKRKFIKDVALFIAGTTIIAKAQNSIKVYKDNTIPVNKKRFATPAGSISNEHFTDFCTACHLCVSSCPTGVLQPAFLEHGLTGILQPYLDNHKGFCNFECVLCSEICPSGAILPIKLSDKKLTQIGIAKFVEKNCIVYTESTDCGACSEHCPTKAVKMEPIGGGLVAPKVYPEYCIGCGACEYACPTKPYKAIYVEGSNYHVNAKPPVVQKIIVPTGTDEFPF